MVQPLCGKVGIFTPYGHKLETSDKVMLGTCVTVGEVTKLLGLECENIQF